MKIRMRNLMAGQTIWRAYLVSLFLIGSAHAQGLPASAAELLKDMKQSGESCRRKDQLAKSTQVVQREAYEPDLNCMISAQELLLWTKAGQSTIVDTRIGRDYAQFRIDGSINLPLHEVVRKEYLRSNSITLVGSGKSERELYVACASLKASGFKFVNVLKGGMLAWLAAEQPVTGRPLPVEQLQRLEPEELFAEDLFTANLLVVSAGESNMLKDLSYAVASPLGDVEGLKQLLAVHRREGKGRTLSAVVWVGSNQTNSVLLAHLRLIAAPLPFLVYLGGEAVYQRYLLEQKAVWLAQARGPKQPNCGL
jgi:rhodanese-related sulfurtransferase